MKKKSIIVITVLMSIILFSALAFATGNGKDDAISKYGWLTIVPPIVAIALAFITKNVVVSLFLGIFTGSFIIQSHKYNFFTSIIKSFTQIVDYLITSLADPWNAGIILQVLTIGGLIGLITKMGGAKAVAEALSKKAKGPVSTQVITWVLGLFIFFDDYANALIVGPIMRPVTDRMRISRERLAFIIDATAAPIAGLALISTWIGYEIGLINNAYLEIGKEVNAYGVFVETIPFRFYNIIMLGFVLLTSLLLREFGPMREAENRARIHNKLIADEAVPMASDDMEDLKPIKGKELKMRNAIVPIMSLIIFAFLGFYFNGKSTILAGKDKELISLLKDSPLSFTALREAFSASDASAVLFQSALISSIIAMAMGKIQGMFTIGEAISTWIQGMKSLIMTGVILLLAWSLSIVIKELETAKFIVENLSDSMPAFLLPSIIFILGAIISFATGTAYGTMGILMPLAVPLAAKLSGGDPNFILASVGAVLTGAIFGDHASPISDTTILSSMGAASDHMDHVKTQMPYALTVAAIAIIGGYIPTGLGLSVWIALPISLALMVGTVFVLGKKVIESKENIKKENN